MRSCSFNRQFKAERQQPQISDYKIPQRMSEKMSGSTHFSWHRSCFLNVTYTLEQVFRVRIPY